jgi:[ribosomal protein S18]-alanine N-acetyltransferase
MILGRTANANPPWTLQAMGADDLGWVSEVEKTAYAYPWGLRHFESSLAAGHWMQMLLLPPHAANATLPAHAPTLPDGHGLVGYAVAMTGVDEVHLLNITTAPAHRRQGWARLMMNAFLVWARTQRATQAWLEVRRSNHAAQALYEQLGFETVGMRRGYYPDAGGQREDARVMCLALGVAPSMQESMA